MSRKAGEYMGMWQLFQACNCIGQPIYSVYPSMYSKTFQNDINRKLFPYAEELRTREPVYIMWTPTVTHVTDAHGNRRQPHPNHFVPLML